MKKLIALVLCLVMVLAVFTACNGNNNESKIESKPESTASVASTVEEDKVAELVIARYGGTTKNMDAATVTKATNDYIGPKYNLSIEEIYLDDYASTVQLKISSKEKIDIFWMNGGS